MKDILTSKPVRIAKKLHVQFSFEDGQLRAEWDRDEAPAALPNRLYKRYVTARDEFMTEVAQQVGGSVMVVNADLSTTTIDKPGVH